MLKRIVLIENGEQTQCDDLQSIVKALIDEKFYQMSPEERTSTMTRKALGNTLNSGKEVVQEMPGNEFESLLEYFIIKDEMTYILSLLLSSNLMLLERKDSDIFTRGIDKSQIKENYIIVNAYAEELLKRYLEEKQAKKDNISQNELSER